MNEQYPIEKCWFLKRTYFHSNSVYRCAVIISLNAAKCFVSRLNHKAQSTARTGFEYM